MQHDKHVEGSKLYFEGLQRMEGEIHAARGDKTRRRRLEWELASMRRRFANHLTIDRKRGLVHCYSREGQNVVPYWRIDGVPNKPGKLAAAKWMSERGVSWDGSAPALRSQVRKALERGEELPTGNFGLHIEWTVRIETTEWVARESSSRIVFVPGAQRYS